MKFLNILTLYSLASGQYGTYETISSWAFLFGAGLGNVEFGITVSLTQEAQSHMLIHFSFRPILEYAWSINNVTEVILVAWYVSSHTFKDLISQNQTWYWHRAPDPGSRSHSMYNREDFEKWDVEAEQPADLVIMQLGGNDHRHPNEIPGPDFYHAYVELIEDIHRTWPHAIILIMVCSPFWSNGVLG